MQSPTTPREHPLATAYEQAIPAGIRLQNGQYYTPAAVCDFMLAFSKSPKLETGDPIRVLEPGCGPGSFLVRLGDWLNTAPHPGQTWELHGIELDPQAAQLAQKLVESTHAAYSARIHTLNFMSPAVDELGPFDWIIGNP